MIKETKMDISPTVSQIPTSPTLAVTAKAKALKAQGKDVIGFGAGEPDFDTSDHIKEAAIKALKGGMTKYTPVGGIPELKDAIVSRTKEDYALDVTPENIIVSCGAKHSLFNLFLAIFKSGDEVICPLPYWVSYPPIIRIAGATPVTIDTTSNSMRLTADQLKSAITERTRGIIINSPCNPTGTTYTKAELEQIAEICVENDLIIISDDIYHKIVFKGSEFFSIAHVSPDVAKRTFIVQGVSKTYAMTGWRIGYCIGDRKVIAAMTRLQSQSTSNPTSFAQAASVKALTGTQDIVGERRAIFEKRKGLMVSMIRDIPGFDIIPPQGAFYCFPSIKGHMERFESASKLADFLLDKALVAVVPGEGFGSPDHIRLSFALNKETIKNGLNRIKEALS